VLGPGCRRREVLVVRLELDRPPTASRAPSHLQRQRDEDCERVVLLVLDEAQHLGALEPEEHRQHERRIPVARLGHLTTLRPLRPRRSEARLKPLRSEDPNYNEWAVSRRYMAVEQLARARLRVIEGDGKEVHAAAPLRK
jgi:hypothetical protein